MKELSGTWKVVIADEIRRIPELAEDEAEAEQELMDMIVEELESERIAESKFKVGDRVHKISLFSVNTPVSGGFPWHKEDVATVLSYHPHGTQWYTTIYTTPIYLIKFDRTWMREEDYNNHFTSVYPAHESQLVKVEDFGK